jgi:membrane protein YqaA with SNARE-associated domain
MALLFTVVGTCMGPVIGRAFFPAMSRELFDFNSLAFAGTGAILGAMIGYPLGRFLGDR